MRRLLGKSRSREPLTPERARTVILPRRSAPAKGDRSSSVDRKPLERKDRREYEDKLMDGSGTKAITRLVLLAILDTCYGKADCFPSNERLAMKVNCDPQYVPRILRRLEALKLILCIFDQSIRSRRRIIVLGHPHAAAVLAELARSPFLVARNPCLSSAAREAIFDRCKGNKNSRCKGEKNHRCKGNQIHPRSVLDSNFVVVRTQNLNPEEKPPEQSTPIPIQRQRPEPEPMPTPAPAEQPDMTLGQSEFLASIPAERRANWAAASPGRRKQMLGVHAAGFNAAIFQAQLVELASIRPVGPVEQPPINAAELVHRLSERGTPAEWAMTFAGALCRDFRTAKDQKFWGQYLGIGRGVQAGLIDPEHVCNALGQAVKLDIRNPAAKFWAALKCLAGIDQTAVAKLAKGIMPS